MNYTICFIEKSHFAKKKYKFVYVLKNKYDKLFLTNKRGG